MKLGIFFYERTTLVILLGLEMRRDATGTEAFVLYRRAEPGLPWRPGLEVWVGRDSGEQGSYWTPGMRPLGERHCASRVHASDRCFTWDGLLSAARETSYTPDLTCVPGLSEPGPLEVKVRAYLFIVS